VRIFRNLAEIPADFGPTVISIGNFDGVHLGHRKVLREVVKRARELSAKALAVTFEPHPAKVLRPQNAPKLITPGNKRVELLGQCGLDAVLVLAFNRELSLMSSREFAAKMIAEKLRAREIHEGENFQFGHQAEGNVERLEEFGRELGFAVKPYSVLRAHGETVSSSNIRRLLAEGNVRRARQLLGRPFAISASPAAGRGYGRKYTVPTINLARYDELAPGNGVYVTCARIGTDTFESVTNIGVRPTFGEDSFAIETHLLDFRPIEIAGDAEVELTFLARLRGEMRWPSVEALREQIARDVQRARRYFHLKKRSPKAAAR